MDTLPIAQKAPTADIHWVDWAQQFPLDAADQ
jgi:hypothetical protein